MASELSPQSKHQLERFCRQFLQLDIFQWPDPENLRSDAFQAALYARLFADNAILHKPPPRYQLKVLKELTRRIEEFIVDWEEEGISDDLMTYLSTFLSSPLPSEVSAAQQKAYVTYTISSISQSNPPASTSTYPNLSNAPTITLLEARSLLAASGTTGLRTWEAALHFGHYLTTHPSIIKSKNILELGAGTGYLSILCAKHLGASHVLATDGSEEVVADLPTNFYLNGLQDKETQLGAEDERKERERRAVIEAKELTWGQALLGTEHPQYNNGHPIDVVLGADVTYDATTIMALIGTFGDLFDLFPNVKILIAATIRNEKTFDLFLESCKRARYQVEGIKASILEPALQEGPFYADRVPIELCCIKRNGN